MAITTQDLFEALRIGTGTIPREIQNILARHLATAEQIIDDYATGAPDALKDEAMIRLSAYLFDSPAVQSITRSPLNNSGAASLLTRYRVRRAAKV